MRVHEARRGIGEDSVRLEDLRGQVVALNFWNTGCVPRSCPRQVRGTFALADMV
jgi:hypothetical protein